MAVLDILIEIGKVIGLFIVGFAVGFPIAWLIFKIKLKRWEKKIPEEIKKEVEDERKRKQDELEEAKRKYSSGEYGEFKTGLRGQTEYLEPADTSIPRIAESGDRKSLQVPEVKTIAGAKPNPKKHRISPDELKHLFE